MMWWTEDNKRPLKEFDFLVPIDKKLELWFSVEQNRIPFFMPNVSGWCRTNKIEWYLKKVPNNLSDTFGAERVAVRLLSDKKSYTNQLLSDKKSYTKEDLEKIKIALLCEYDVIATFKTSDMAIFFKLRWC